MIYGKSFLAWGCELEFGDVPRWIEIPKHLGSWNEFETDIVNQRHPFWGIAADPYGKDPQFGGEINTAPTKTWLEQIKIINDLIVLFNKNNFPPTVSCVQQFHIHVSLSDEIFKDRNAIRNLLRYTKDNQKDFIESVSQFQYDERMSESAVEFLKNDGGRVAPSSMYDRMIYDADNNLDFLYQDETTHEDNYIKRFGVNLKSLFYNSTIEFRCFRASVDLKELLNCFRICEYFMLSAINGNSEPFRIHYKSGNYKLPPFVYDHDLFESWEKTKKQRRADKKNHSYVPFNEI